MTSSYEPDEHSEQKTFVQWCRLHNIPVAAVPNGFFSATKDKRFWGQISKLKSEGYSSGFPDLIVLLPGEAVFIEMKRKKGGTVSKEQREWIAVMTDLNIPVYVCRGADEAIYAIERRLRIPM